MINEFLCPELENMDVVDVFFQENDATCHTSGETMSLLRGKFPGRVISLNGDCNGNFPLLMANIPLLNEIKIK